MIFQNPAGLLALTGIPLLILLYFIKPKYEERTVSSAYLWKLSERFLRKHMPVQRLKKLLLFMLQFLLIIVTSLLIAQPRLSFWGTGTEYIAILDASGSMLMADKAGKTRFDRAREEVLAQLDTLRLGSVVTVLATNEENALTDRTQSLREARYAVEHLKCSYGIFSPDAALEKAQKIIGAHPEAQVYFYTDKSYPAAENITVVDVSNHLEWNAALTNFTSKPHTDGTAFFADVISYDQDASVTIALYVDQKLTAAQIKQCPAGETVTVEFDISGLYDFTQARAVLNVTDALSVDNAFCLFNPSPESVRVLLISENPFYFSNVLSAFRTVDVITVSDPEQIKNTGYDLYIYDGCMPDALPADGAIWFFNPLYTPADMDIVLGEELLGSSLSAVKEFDDPALAGLTKNMTCRDAAVMKFREIVSNGSYAAIMLCGKLPVALAGTSINGAKRIIVAFDLKESNLPMLTDYVYFISNALNFSMPAMLDGQLFMTEDTLSATVLPFAKEVFLLEPDGSMCNVPIKDGTASVTLHMPGAYTMFQRRGELNAKYYDFFAAFPFKESDPTLASDMSGLTLSIAQTEGAMEAEAENDRLYNPSMYLVLLLLILLVLECVVYQREQF